MPVKKKRSLEEEEEESETADIESNLNGSPHKYTAGKFPRQESVTIKVDYDTPLDPISELYKDNWTIPKFNLFVSFTLDFLVETYKAMFKDFIKLPSRKFHPQYYYKIERPISINEIKSRDYEYKNGNIAFLLDVELLSKNCAAYNETDTMIVKNSLQIVHYIKYEVLKAKNIKRNYLISNDVKAKMLTYIDRVLNATDRSIDEQFNTGIKNSDDKLKISEPFAELVDRNDLPEYYEVIYRPIAINLIKKNLEVGLYSKIYDVIIDMQLVFENALVFNNSDTLIYQDAKKLLNFFNHLMQTKFFPELIDANERGEIKLEYNKVEMEHFFRNEAVEDKPVASVEENEETDYDFNHVEGLGNGYNRSLLNEDFLLGPSKEDSVAKANSSTVQVEEQPKQYKYNIVKSLQKETVSEDYIVEKKPYELIKKISIYSSESVYGLATRPLPGSRPSCSQNWVDFTFEGAKSNQNENMYSFSLQPIQNALTLSAELQKIETVTTLHVNKELINLNRKLISLRPDQHQNVLQEQLTDGKPQTYDFNLNEGLNFIEFKCDNTKTGITETMKFCVNVLP